METANIHRTARSSLSAATIVIALSAALPALAVSGRNTSVSTPRLLIDLARDHALNRRAGRTTADALHVRTLLRAALRLNSRAPEPYYWLYELASLRGDADEAHRLLGQLVTVEPENDAVFQRWVESGLDRARTYEERRAWLEGLRDTPRPEQLKIIVEHSLARLHLDHMDRAAALEAFGRARALRPDDPALAELALDLLPDDASRSERLRAILAALRANPLQVELPWRVATLLDQVGLPVDAYVYYQYAIAVHHASSERAEPPYELIELSRNAVTRNDLEAALDWARQASRSERTSYEPAFYLHWLLIKTGRIAEAEALASEMAQRFAAINDPHSWGVGLLAQAAWFYCTIDPQPQRALVLAEEAAGRAAGDPFAARVLGWAQALNQQQQAAATLGPLARRDPAAAARLARIHIESGDQDAAIRVLNDLELTPHVGPARDWLDELDLPGVSTRPTRADTESVVRVLAEFDREILRFRELPARYLKVELTLDDLSPAPGEPWWGTFSITNHADFPITLGADRMVSPVFLLSFRTEGDRTRDYPALLTVTLDSKRMLAPGETIRVRQTLDVGPLRKLARRTPSQVQRISIQALFDPQRDAAGTWGLSDSGQELRRISFNRLPAQTSREAWNARFAAFSGDSRAARFRAIEAMAQLLGEQQNARLDRLGYQPQPIPRERVHSALLSALASASPETRVRVLDSLQVVGLDRRMLSEIEACLTHENWLVRLMAVRLLGERRRAGFVDTARGLADDDSDELVRDLARSYVERFADTPSAASQPSESASP